MPRISVIICSLNPRPDYFRRVLDSLEAQTLSKELWELVLVDNGSERPLADSWDLSWHPHHLHVRESDVGLTPARLRGIAATSSPLLIFFDDDNVVAPDYLERAVQIALAYPFLSVFGAGTIDPELETDASPEVRPLLPYLALRTVPERLWTNSPSDNNSTPWGPGLCVDRSIADAYTLLVNRLRITHLLDRRGSRLFAGGDDLFSWVAAGAGSGFGIFPELRVIHLVRASRLQKPYLLQLLHDHAYSHGILAYMLWGRKTSRSVLENMLRVALNGVRRGPFSMRCRWATERGAASANRDILAQDLRPLNDRPMAVPRLLDPVAERPS